MTDQDRIHELNYRIAKERENRYRRELVQLACESVKRDLALAKLEAEVIASRDIVRKAVTRAEELERLVREYQEAFNASDGITESMAAKAKRVALFAAVPEKEGE